MDLHHQTVGEYGLLCLLTHVHRFAHFSLEQEMSASSESLTQEELDISWHEVDWR